MPRYSDSLGGWIFGREDGSAILEVVATTAVRFETSGEALAHIVVAMTEHEKRLMLRWVDAPSAESGWKGIVMQTALAENILYWRKDSTPTDALRSIEESENGLPPSVCGGFLAAAAAREKKLPEDSVMLAAYTAACACLPGPFTKPPRFRSRKELEHLADTLPLADLLQGRLPDGASGTDLARLVMILGERLWKDQWLTRKIADGGIEREAGILNNALPYPQSIPIQIATVNLLLRPEPAFEVEGARLRIRSAEKNLGILFPEAFLAYETFLRFEVPGDVIKAMYPEGIIDPSAIDQLGAVEKMSRESTKYPAGRHMLVTVLEEADRKAAHGPQGVYKVLLPEELPMRQAGVEQINVYVDQRKMYVQLCTPIPAPTLFVWSPDYFQSNTDYFPDFLDLALAAIWHDLRVAGEEAFPAVGDDDREPLPDDEDLSEAPVRKGRRGASARGVAARLVPALALQGRRIWGRRAEREYLVRRRHRVIPFRRALPATWKRRDNALDLAVLFGLVLRDEHDTVVEPHHRGKREPGEKDEPPAPVIRSRGLAALMAYYDFVKEEDSHAEVHPSNPQ